MPETKNPKIWFYRYEHPPYSTGMNDAPAQRYFYSEANDGENSETLNNKITRYEGNTITPILTMLECLDPGQQIDGILPAQLISHLIIRNDHSRKLGASIFRKCI